MILRQLSETVQKHAKQEVRIGFSSTFKIYCEKLQNIILFNIFNPFGTEFFWKITNFAHKFDKVLQKRVLLGIGMKEWVSIGVIREAKWRSLMQK